MQGNALTRLTTFKHFSSTVSNVCELNDGKEYQESFAMIECALGKKGRNIKQWQDLHKCECSGGCV